jgi:hypothetical protein
MPQVHLPCHSARPDQQRHDSRRPGVKSSYGLVLSAGAVDSPSDGSGLTGSGVRRGTSVGSGVAVGVGSGDPVGWAVGAAVGSAEGSLVGASVAGAVELGSTDGSDEGSGRSLAGGLIRVVITAATTKAVPIVTMKATAAPNAVTKAAAGRSIRATMPRWAPEPASKSTTGTRRAAKSAEATGAGLAWSAATIPLRVSASAAHEEQVLRCP